ncbi:ribulose-phosphate 3-epimerase [Muribaculaceae bacterium]|jgi:ribulose-phosphate 3-epimerase|nr:ribulose-phosphate 3-epimerase [Muribaculaceae bacterium]
MIVAPSILSADFGCLGESIAMLESGGADWIHCDVMDGVFVPNISFGFPVISAVGKLTRKPLDVHLMIVNPEQYVGRVRDCGAMMMNVHYEACTHLHRTVQSIHTAGMKAGVTLNPATPVAILQDIIADIDMVLLMSVNPGFGGQSFIEHTIKKIEQTRALIAESGSKALIEVDGGINRSTGALCAQAGADILVAGNSIFSSADPHAEITFLKNL